MQKTDLTESGKIRLIAANEKQNFRLFSANEKRKFVFLSRQKR
jgi:hypothetical protein